MHNKENIALESNNRNGDTDGFTHPKFRYSCQKDLQGRETPTLKNSRFSGNFCFYEMELNVSEKFANFHAMLDNFLLSIVGVIFPILPEIECSSVQKFCT